ncbi:hypothetical protein ACLX1H_010869 [Fusarium chlamydosporum]
MNPFANLPNEIIDKIFSDLGPVEIWTFQQASPSCERALDHHLQARPNALEELMQWACCNGNNTAVRKAVSLGADLNVIRSSTGSVRSSTIITASDHMDTVSLLFDLGARLDANPDPEHTYQRRREEENRQPKFYKLCYERGVQDQFVNFQASLDSRFYWMVMLALLARHYERAPDIKNIKICLDAGANACAPFENKHRGYSTLSNAIWRSVYKLVPLPDLPIIKLLLSRKPDVNALALLITEEYLEEPNEPHRWEACPIVAATCWLALRGSTKMMDMLLKAGAKLDLPVHPKLNPLVVYARKMGSYNAEGYEYLFKHGAKIEPHWHPNEIVEGPETVPILLLWESYRGRACLLLDEKYAALKLFIQKGALKGIGLQFIQEYFRRPVDQDNETEKQSVMADRSYKLLKLVLEDENFESSTMMEDLEELFMEITHQAIFLSGQTGSSGLSFTSFVDPILAGLLLKKGVMLRANAQNLSMIRLLKDGIVSSLQGHPYYIECDF